MGSTRHRNTKKSVIKYKLKTKGGDPKYYASCEGKLRRSKDDAYAMAHEVDTMSAYKCRFCNYYHVGRKQWRG